MTRKERATKVELKPTDRLTTYLNSGGKPDPRFTLNGVVRLLAASTAKAREKVVRDYKYPADGGAQGNYYGWARDAIRRYHLAGNDPVILDQAERSMLTLMSGASPAAMVKLENNLRVIRTYRKPFGARTFAPQSHNPQTVFCEGVEINLRPDMVAVEKGRTRLIRYEFAKEGATKEELRYTMQLLFFYARQIGLTVANQDCLLLIVGDGECHKASGPSKSFEAHLKAGMREAYRCWKAV